MKPDGKLYYLIVYTLDVKHRRKNRSWGEEKEINFLRFRSEKCFTVAPLWVQAKIPLPAVVFVKLDVAWIPSFMPQRYFISVLCALCVTQRVAHNAPHDLQCNITGRTLRETLQVPRNERPLPHASQLRCFGEWIIVWFTRQWSTAGVTATGGPWVGR